MKMINRTRLVAITGGSGAGKTWLAGWLQRALGTSAARLSLDNFYLDRSRLPREERAEINFDHPDAMDWPLFAQVLDDCRRGQPTRVPRYNFVTHTRLPVWDNFVPAPLLLVEGLWLLWQPHIRDRFDLKIFIDCADRLRLERRLARDVAERGRSAESVRTQFWKTVAPMHDQFVAPQAKYADIILQTPVANRELRGLVEIMEVELFTALARETSRFTREALQPADVI